MIMMKAMKPWGPEQGLFTWEGEEGTWLSMYAVEGVLLIFLIFLWMFIYLLTGHKGKKDIEVAREPCDSLVGMIAWVLSPVGWKLEEEWKDLGKLGHTAQPGNILATNIMLQFFMEMVFSSSVTPWTLRIIFVPFMHTFSKRIYLYNLCNCKI